MRAVVARVRRQLHVGGIGAGFAFGQSEGRELLAVHQFREPFFLLLFRPEKQERANPDRVMRIGEDRRRSAAPADFLQHLAVLHLGKTAAAHFLRRGHAEHADAAEAIDDMARDIGLAIDLLGIEMFIQENAQLIDRAIDIGLLRVAQAGVGHGPVGHEISEEETLGKTKFLAAAEEEFLGLLNFLLSLDVGFGECHRIR